MAANAPNTPRSNPLGEHGSLPQKAITLFMVAAPIAGLVLMWQLNWPYKLTWLELEVALGMHLLAAGGITIGFHRLLTHRSFTTSPLMRFLLASLGSLAIEGPVINWVSDHRKHHDFTDEEGDPHSPHVGFGSGILGIFRGLWHAQVGWLISSPQSNHVRYAPDLLEDPVVMWVSRRFGYYAVAAFAIPFAIGWSVTGSLHGALAMTFWAGAMRMCFTHHVTWSINSICHMIGTRPFQRRRNTDLSTNFVLLALLTLGEAWHHNHHVFPTSAYHGLRWWERMLDPSGWVIWWMKQFRLVWNVKHPTRKEWKAKLASQAQPQPI